MLASSHLELNNQITPATKDEIRCAFILTLFLVYYHEAIINLNVEQLKKMRETIKDIINVFKDFRESKNSSELKDSSELHEIELKEILKIFDDYIYLRENKKNEASFCEKANEILRWICNKIISFFSFLISSCQPSKTVPTKTEESPSESLSRSPHRLFPVSPTSEKRSEEKFVKDEAGKIEHRLV